MTLLELLQQPSKVITKVFKDAGYKSHHDFNENSPWYYSKEELKDKPLIDLCNKLGIDRGNCNSLQYIKFGDHCLIIFYFDSDFITVKNYYPGNCSVNFEVNITGTNEKNFKVSTPYYPGSNNFITIYAQKLYFFDNREDINNFEFELFLPDDVICSVTKFLEYLEIKSKKVNPYIKWYLETIETGDYENAYNIINTNPFNKGHEIWEGFTSTYIITLNQYIDTVYKYKMNILDTLLLYKWYADTLKKLPNNYNWAELFDNMSIDEVKNIIASSHEKYVISSNGKHNKEILETVKVEYKNRVNQVIKDLCNEFNIHESYFGGVAFLKVITPKMLNCDLSQPCEGNYFDK